MKKKKRIDPRCKNCEYNNKKNCGVDFCIMPFCLKDRLEYGATGTKTPRIFVGKTSLTAK